MLNSLYGEHNNLLPTKINLAKRKVVDDDFCPLCGTTKTIIHALWEYPAACDVQGKGDNPLREWSLNGQYFWSFWIHLVDNTSKKKNQGIMLNYMYKHLVQKKHFSI